MENPYYVPLQKFIANTKMGGRKNTFWLHSFNDIPLNFNRWNPFIM